MNQEEIEKQIEVSLSELELLRLKLSVEVLQRLAAQARSLQLQLEALKKEQETQAKKHDELVGIIQKKYELGSSDEIDPETGKINRRKIKSESQS